MANTIKIKHGLSAPKNDTLEEFELGYCSGDGLLYIGTPQGVKTVGSPLISEINASDSASAVNSIAIINYSVPLTRTINNKDLSSNIVLSAADVGAVPTTRTVNGKALSSNIILSASDVGARASTWVPTAAQVGAFQVDGIGTSIPSGADLDTYTTPGKYSAGSSTISASLNNPPTTSTGFSMIVMDNYIDGRVYQVAFDNTGGIKFRYYNSVSWKEWGRIYTTDNPPTAAAVGAMRYLGVNLSNYNSDPTTDAPGAWIDRGVGVAAFNANGRVEGQPNQWGHIINMTEGNLINQIWVSPGKPIVYVRGGNRSGWQHKFTPILAQTLPSTAYGTTLPSSAPSGQIFFKKV